MICVGLLKRDISKDARGVMESEYFGTEPITEADRAYNGSRFGEVRDALLANPYQRVWGGDGEPSLPIYDVTLGSVLRGILPKGKPYLFRQATERAVDSHADLRWGTMKKGSAVCCTRMASV